MTVKRKFRSAEEKAQLLEQIDGFVANENLTVVQACEKVGINPTLYYGWRSKGKGKRKKKKPILTSAVVPLETITPSAAENFKGSLGSDLNTDSIQMLEALAVMNARSLQTLLSRRST